MSLVLYAPKSHLNNATKVDVVADFLQIPLQYKRIPPAEWKSPEYLKKHPLGRIPLLQTPEGDIVESMAIVRYLARKSGKLYGKNAIETASIDQWLEYINSQISGYQRILIFGLLGFAMSLPVTNKERYNQVKKEFLDMMKDIDTGLKGQDYLVKDMSVADVVLAVHLRYFFTLMFDEKIRSSFPNLTKWFVRMAEKPAFMNYFGKTWLCKKEVVPNYEYFAKVQKQLEEAQNKPKKEEKKEQPKKQKKVEEDAEEEVEAPKKKQANPLDLLPKSNFILDDFKRDFVNSEDLKAACDRFWQTYDAEGWSLWKLHYVLYEGQGKVGYLTCNLKNGFIRNLDHFRKYSFGVIGAYGEEGNLVIEGAMLWRGTEIPNEWKQHNSYDYFEFKKLDHKNGEDRKLIESYWTNIDGCGEGPVEGKPVYEAKWFK